MTSRAASTIRKNRLPPLSLLRAAYKHRLALALTFVLGSAVAAAIVYQLPAVYRAEALILVESQRIPEKFVASTVDVNLRDRINTISQQILSYRHLLEIIEKFNLYRAQRLRLPQEEVVEVMRKDIEIRVEQGWPQDRPGAFRVAYHGPDPNVVALVANQLANLFIEENLRAREVHALGTSEFLETQLAEARKRLEEQEARLSAYKLRHNGELPQQENVLISTAARYQLQLQGVQEGIA
ncbi:MAG: GumC family protein, partial [Bryobacteraceae bacterium]